jgi:hypothetical protein
VKVRYTIPVRPGEEMPVPEGAESIMIGEARVEWQTDDQGVLRAVSIEFSGIEPQLDERGVILSDYPEVEDRAYEVATYLANRIFPQTAFEPIDPARVLDGSPKLSPEGPDESALFEGRKKYVSSSLTMLYGIHGIFDPDEYEAGFEHSAAHAYYAAAARSPDVFQQFELYFKIAEYFFAGAGSKLDRAVSEHVVQFDTTLDAALVRSLRIMRNRCTHPRAAAGHLGPHCHAHAREVQQQLPRIKRLAELLLDHPPVLPGSDRRAASKKQFHGGSDLGF